jgi:hypothetical protein
MAPTNVLKRLNIEIHDHRIVGCETVQWVSLVERRLR